MEEVKDRPLLSIITIVVGALFGLLGSIFGAIWLAVLWGIRVPFDRLILTHPGLQLHGFLTLFIMGVAYVLIPRFKNKRISGFSLAHFAILSAVVADGILLIGQGRAAQIASDLMLMIGAVSFAIFLIPILGRPREPLALAEPYMHLSVAALILMSTAKLLADILFLEGRYIYLHPGYLGLSILGFPGMMIFGVSIRTIHFRPVSLRRGPTRVALPVATAAVLTSFASILSYDFGILVPVSLLLFAIAFTLLVYSTRMIAHADRSIINRMNLRDKLRYLYFSRALTISGYWLLIGIGFATVYSFMSLLGLESLDLRDSMIHALTIGFIGTMIMAYAPILLPPLLSGRTPYTGLSLLPVYLVSSANAWRMVANFLHWSFGFSFWGNGLMGIPILLGFGLFVVMIHSLI